MKKKMKKKKYWHLCQQDRDRIQALLDNNHKQKDIAKVLGRDKSTISREIQKNRRKIRKPGGTINGHYEATKAQHKSYVRRWNAKYQGKKINKITDLIEPRTLELALKGLSEEGATLVV